MPLTRSQSRKLENQNIEITCINNTRFVKFSTPQKEDQPNICPPTPRAPRAAKKIYATFESVVRKLDFDPPKKREQYPLNYKNFVIANKFQKKKVDEFINLINTFTDKNIKNTNNVKILPKLYPQQLSTLSDEDLLEMAKTLNSNTKFWKIFHENDYGETTMSCAVYYWANLLSSLVLNYFTRIVNASNMSSSHISSEIIANKIIPGLITFKEVFMNENFPRFSVSRRFLGTIIQKMMQFADSGYLLAALVIKHYYPHMITKECRLIVNKLNNSTLYLQSLKFAETTSDPEIARLFKECKLIYNFE